MARLHYFHNHTYYYGVTQLKGTEKKTLFAMGYNVILQELFH